MKEEEEEEEKGWLLSSVDDDAHEWRMRIIKVLVYFVGTICRLLLIFGFTLSFITCRLICHQYYYDDYFFQSFIVNGIKVSCKANYIMFKCLRLSASFELLILWSIKCFWNQFNQSFNTSIHFFLLLFILFPIWWLMANIVWPFRGYLIFD